MEKIALLPGGFKPPHAGHYNMAKWLASNTDADTVVIKVGAKERDGITRDMSLQLWDLYRSTDPDPLAKKLTILPSDSNSPVKDVYDFIENEAPEGSTIYLGMGEKDIGDARFKNIGKFAEPKGISFKTTLVPPQAGGVSGTEMRSYIKKNKFSDFVKYLPKHLQQSGYLQNDAWAVATKMSDYSSPKGGTQSTNLGEDVDEMAGMMTKQEKVKHAKNMKRLKKDMSKMKGNNYGGGGYKVPDYIKGTLTRKLYHEDLYDPNDHYYDFAKTNDPNPKPPVTPAYKYKRAGAYSAAVGGAYGGRLYENSTAAINGNFIPLEVMDDIHLQVQGMMGRDKLKGGMVFPYERVAKREFHMQNCKIPLDIIFIANNTIQNIHHNCPPCQGNNCPKYSGVADNVFNPDLIASRCAITSFCGST